MNAKRPVGEGRPSAAEDRTDAVASGEWRRFHALTPLASVLRMWLSILVAAAWFSRDWIERQNIGTLWGAVRDLGMRAVGWALLAFLAVSVVSSAVAVVVWHVQAFSLGSDGIRLRSGVVLKKRVHVKWGRIQSVEVQRSLLARMLGLGSVTVESAAAGKGMRLGWLTKEQCEGLRGAILKAADDARADRPVRVLQWREGASELFDEPRVYELQPGRLLASLMLSPVFFIGILSAAASIVLLAFDKQVALLPVALVLLGAAWGGIGALSRKWGASLSLTPDGLRLRSGLASQKATTVLPMRVQTVRVRQRLLWRRLGWWSVEVEVAKTRFTLNEEGAKPTELVTAGSMRDVERVLWALIPDLGVDEPEAFLKDAFEGKGPSELFVAAPRASRALDPFGWRRNAEALTRTVAVLRWGRFFGRSLRIVWHARLQGLRLSQGLVQRALGLASLRLSTAAMAIETVQKHLRLADARSLCERQSQLGRDRRAEGDRESIEGWRERLGIGIARQFEQASGRDGRTLAAALTPGWVGRPRQSEGGGDLKGLCRCAALAGCE